jgi:hypothetical protein
MCLVAAPTAVVAAVLAAAVAARMSAVLIGDGDGELSEPAPDASALHVAAQHVVMLSALAAHVECASQSKHAGIVPAHN